MKFSIANSVRSRARIATPEGFWRIVDSQEIRKAMCDIQEAKSKEELADRKKRLPIACWQAWFDGGVRSDRKAHHSGLFMLDIDGVENPARLYAEKVAGRVEELGIRVVHITPSRKGLRIVADCPARALTIADCQAWLAKQLDVPYDEVCKDFARSSFLVPREMFEYFDGKIFKDVPKNILENPAAAPEAPSNSPRVETCRSSEVPSLDQSPSPGGGREGAVEATYKGFDIREIAKRWLLATGGEPVEGERNARLYQLAIQLRYITDFDADRIFDCIPHYGLGEKEVRQLIKSALEARRNSTGVPVKLQEVVETMNYEKKEEEEEAVEDCNIFRHLLKNGKCLPEEMLPPIFREYVRCQPEDFKTPTYMALLPLLGTLASKLRAPYFDGVLQSPSFQVEVEAPMASGKSFVTRLYESVMYPLEESDEINREKEREYKEKLKAAKNAKTQPEIESYPVRLIPATASITQVLRRMANANGSHLLSFTDEIRIVLESYGRGSYGNLRALMRNAFDNSKFGQDFANSEAPNDYVRVFLNTLHAGTPAEYAKFYNNVEDGTVSRVLFVVLPDQFGKKYQKRIPMSVEDTAWVQDKIQELNETTMNGSEVLDDVVMLRDFDFMAEWAQNWCLGKQQIAVKYKNRDLDTFMRRSAAVGFRAGMIIWYLLGQEPTKENIEMTLRNAEWVAEYMVWQLCRRYETAVTSNTIQYFELWNMLGREFTAIQLQDALKDSTYKTPAAKIIYKWANKGLITKVGSGNYQKLIN